MKVEKPKTQQKPIIIMPLKDITKWHPRTFTVRGKFTHKSEIKYKGKYTQTAYFYAIFMDVYCTEKKVNFWANFAEDWINKLKIDSIYEIYGLAPKEQPPKFQEYGPVELNVNKNTKLDIKEYTDEDEDEDDDLRILTQSWSFVPNIAAIKQKPQFAVIDVIGIISDLEPATTQFTRNNSDTPIRRIEIVDRTSKVKVTLWDEQTKIPLKLHQVIALKRVKVSDYGGKSLNLKGYIVTKVEHTLADELSLWYMQHNTTFANIIAQIQSITTAQASIEDYTNAVEISCQEADKMQQMFRITQKMPKLSIFKVKGSICDINSTLFHYKQTGGKASWSLRIKIKDLEGHNFRAICFEESGTQIMKGYTGEAAAELQCTNMDELYKLIQNIINNGQQRMFSIRTKQNTYFADRHTLDYIVDEVEDC